MAERLLTVAKVLRITQLLAQQGALSLTDICERLEMNKTVIHRALSTLRDEGWVVQEAGTRRYRLGLRMWEVGMGALHHFPVYAVALPQIEQLAGQFKETAGLAVYDDGEMLFLARVGVVDGAPVSVPLAGRALPHTTSGGKVALAFLPEIGEAMSKKRSLTAVTRQTLRSGAALRRELNTIRERGYALNRGGRDDGSSGVAAPVFDHTGMYVASIYVACPTTEFTEEWIGRLAPAVVNCAAQVSRALGHRESSLSVALG
jgi:IclR family KDG regulon transcriptional repressor